MAQKQVNIGHGIGARKGILLTASSFAVVASVALSMPWALASGAVWAQSTGNNAAAPAAKQARVPAELVGIWNWGQVNPGQYVNRSTGAYIGHAGGGMVSYEFDADGTYRRYVLIHMGAGFGNDNIFSAQQGKVTFDANARTFTIHPVKGEITFEEGEKKRKRPLTLEDMKRSGVDYTYRLEKDEDGKTYMFLNDKGKPDTESRRFTKEEKTKP